MEGVVPLIALLLLVAVAAFVSAPVRNWLLDRQQPQGEGDGDGERIAALEAERLAKLRELADAELDFRSGKLDEGSYLFLRERLGREALAIADALAAAESADLEQRDRVGEEEDRKDDRPAVEVPLKHRSAAKGTGAAADAEGSGKT